MKSLLVTITVLLTLGSATAHAAFGRRSGSSSNSSGSHSSSSSSTHAAAPVGSRTSSGSSSHSSSGFSGGYGYGYGRSRYYGYYSGAYVPLYGYGYGSYRAGYGNAYVVERQAPTEESTVRVSAGLEGMVFVNTNAGFSLGVAAALEGERWGFNVFAQNLSVIQPDGSLVGDQLQQLNVHLTFAPLTGKYGRLRLELGADTIWAPDLTVISPTAGVSGSLWIGGPFALEGSVMITPFPIRQIDYRAGVAVGFGPLGLRAGWRTQVLDDQGLVDGVINRDVFMGPYVGLGLAM